MNGYRALKDTVAELRREINLLAPPRVIAELSFVVNGDDGQPVISTRAIVENGVYRQIEQAEL